MVKLNLPLRPWVPQWLGIVTMFVVMFPIIMLNGTYTGSMLEVSSTLGILSEDITMGYYATAAGMAVAYPIIPKIRAIATPKTMLLTDLILQIFLSYICAQVGNMDITIICSFFIGFLKAFIMLEFIIQVRPFFSPKNVRSEFYAYFYPIVFSGGQISMALTAQLLYTPADADCPSLSPGVFPVCQAPHAHPLQRNRRKKHVYHSCCIAFQHLHIYLRKDIRLVLLSQNTDLYDCHPHTDLPFRPSATDTGEAIRQPETTPSP